MAQPVIRGVGVTPSEQYVAGLCERTFLSLWSYPGIYRDQRIAERSEGKELADLIVVFENDIIIFSDKRCGYPETGNAELDWSRWFRKAIDAGARQAWGAERWLRAHPDRLFLDRACAQAFPYDLPEPAKARFHIIVVAHEVAAACAATIGGSGSLMIRSDLRGLTNHTIPFTVGDLDTGRTFVHVFDDTSLDIVMRTVDTIADFVAYLTKKASFLRSGRDVFAAGEEELLAWYLKHANASGEHDFLFPPEVNGSIGLLEGGWLEFQTNPQRLAQIEHDEVSYFWDRMIEEFNKHALNGTQYKVSSGAFRDSERTFRFLARECRTRRRMLSAAWMRMLSNTSAKQDRRRFMTPSCAGDPYYVFLLAAQQDFLTYEEYREYRGAHLEACIRVLKLLYPDALDIVGIAMDSGLETPNRSEDAMYFDARNWNDADQRDAQEVQEKFRIFIEPKPVYERVSEYPAVTVDGRLVHPVPRNPRNRPCPCGSGVKYKKCHGQ